MSSTPPIPPVPPPGGGGAPERDPAGPLHPEQAQYAAEDYRPAGEENRHGRWLWPLVILLAILGVVAGVIASENKSKPTTVVNQQTTSTTLGVSVQAPATPTTTTVTAPTPTVTVPTTTVTVPAKTAAAPTPTVTAPSKTATPTTPKTSTSPSP